jgi:hypothetical protein
VSEGDPGGPSRGIVLRPEPFPALRRTETTCAGSLCRCYHTRDEAAPQTVRLLRAADSDAGEVRFAPRHREARGRSQLSGERRGRDSLPQVRVAPAASVATGPGWCNGSTPRFGRGDAGSTPAPGTFLTRAPGSGQRAWCESGAAAGYAEVGPRASGRRGDYLGSLVRFGGVESVREREVGPASALKGGPPGEPHRQRIAQIRPLTAPLARQHNIPRRAFHATPFVRWRRTGSHTGAFRAT